MKPSLTALFVIMSAIASGTALRAIGPSKWAFCVIARILPKGFLNEKSFPVPSKNGATYPNKLGSIAPWGAALCAIAVVNPALANEENVSPALADQNRAAALVTQPATITNGTLNITNRTNNLKKVSESIGIVRKGCKNINPLEMIKSPGNTFQQCLEDTNNQAAQINQTSQPTEKFEFFKVPELESGINVTVTEF